MAISKYRTLGEKNNEEILNKFTKDVTFYLEHIYE